MKSWPWVCIERAGHVHIICPLLFFQAAGQTSGRVRIKLCGPMVTIRGQYSLGYPMISGTSSTCQKGGNFNPRSAAGVNITPPHSRIFSIAQKRPQISTKKLVLPYSASIWRILTNFQKNPLRNFWENGVLVTSCPAILYRSVQEMVMERFGSSSGFEPSHRNLAHFDAFVVIFVRNIYLIMRETPLK